MRSFNENYLFADVNVEANSSIMYDKEKATNRKYYFSQKG